MKDQKWMNKKHMLYDFILILELVTETRLVNSGDMDGK